MIRSVLILGVVLLFISFFVSFFLENIPYQDPPLSLLKQQNVYHLIAIWTLLLGGLCLAGVLVAFIYNKTK